MAGMRLCSIPMGRGDSGALCHPESLACSCSCHLAGAKSTLSAAELGNADGSMPRK